MTEKQLQGNLVAFLKRRNAGVLRWNAAQYKIGDRVMRAKKGVSDLLICYNGHFYAVEVKSSTGKLRDAQVAFMQEYERYGAICLVISPKNYDQFKKDWPNVEHYHWERWVVKHKKEVK